MATLGDIDPGFSADDDRRHRAPGGGRMRDSLFWEVVLPDERVGLQIYLYLTDRGRVGYNATVWGAEKEPLALVLEGGEVDEHADFDDFSWKGLTLRQPELRRTCEVRFRHEKLEVDFDFVALHDAFSYRRNPDGLPTWFATNRLEQTGHVKGMIKLGDRRIGLDRIGHRDHSWGVRDWGVPHHWKWFVAYTPSGRALNGWIWIAYGEWGFAGYVVRDGVTIPVRTIEHHADYDDDMRQRRLEARLVDITGGVTHLTMDVFGTVQLPTDDKMSTVITEAACSATIDGEAGAGQFETHWAGPYLRYLAEQKQKQKQ